jgi:hypothetical protein
MVTQVGDTHLWEFTLVTLLPLSLSLSSLCLLFLHRERELDSPLQLTLTKQQLDDSALLA